MASTSWCSLASGRHDPCPTKSEASFCLGIACYRASLNSVGAEIGKPVAPQTASVGGSTTRFVRNEAR